MDLITLMVFIGIVSLGYGYMKYADKKTDVGKFGMVLGSGMLLVALAASGGYIEPLAAVQITAPGVEEGYAANGVCQLKPYTKLSTSTQVYGSNSYTTATGTIKFYEEGVDPTGTNANPIDTITVASGVGNTTNGKLTSCTNYGIVFEGTSGTYYDAYFNDVSTTSKLPYVVTDESAISLATISFAPIYTVATIDDPIDESTSAVNGNASNSNKTTATSEICVGNSASIADDDELYYDISVGDGQFYLDLAIGFSGGNKVAKDPVLCFVNDLTNPFEGNEFQSVTAQLRTGTDYGIPSSITNYVNNADCVSLGSIVEGGVSGTYRFTFAMDETLLTAGGDKIYIYVDDLGDHLGQDIRRGTAATASTVVTLNVQA